MLNYHELRKRTRNIREANHSGLTLGWCIGLGIIIFIGGCITSKPAHAYSEAQAIKAIIGEAEDQGLEGMIGIACAIRNRGSLRSVYGLHSPRVEKSLYSTRIAQMAALAWLESAKKDITNGATGWGNDHDLIEFNRHKWWKNCVITAHIGNHWFYRERKL